MICQARGFSSVIKKDNKLELNLSFLNNIKSMNSIYRYLKSLLFVFFLPLAFSCYAADAAPFVLVSVAPHKYFVEKIAGDTVQIELMVPAGASSHTYEPTPRQMLKASQADLWFRMGEGFEARVIKTLVSHKSPIAIIDLRKGVDMITADPHTGHCCCHVDSQDMHFWLSPRQAKIQASTIAEALSDRYPKQRGFYQENLKKFLQELDDLDREITQILQPMTLRTVMVSHPAYAYFCRDYGLQQLSIEFEGKDPTPWQMNNILIQARNLGIKKIFIQAQYSNKGARVFAKELKADVVMLDPYSENYKESMLAIARNFAS